MSAMHPTSLNELASNNRFVDEASNTDIRSPRPWWWQGGIALMEGVAVVVAALGFAAYFALPGRPGDLAAGSAFGLALAIGFGGLWAVHDQWELLVQLHGVSLALNQEKELRMDREKKQKRDEQLKAVNAFYLGYQLAMVVSESAEDSLIFVRTLCEALNLPLWQDEWERLDKRPTNSDDLKSIFDMVRSHVQHSAPKEWWCFFTLGLTVFWLVQRLEAGQSIAAIRRDLQTIRSDDELELDPRYVRLVDQLLSIIPTTLALTDADRATVVQHVNAALAALPKGEPSFRIAPFPLPITDWYWDQAGDIDGVAVKFVGSGLLTAYPGGRYDLHGLVDHDDCVVRFENSDWMCSAHSEATMSQPCSDIELVYDLTNGGLPVTEARVRPVRFVEVGSGNAIPYTADSDSPASVAEVPEARHVTH